ncbi:hypothetical protein OCOJLMKI_1705 [Methylobacterium iners]|uniref:Blue-light-activated histidine kinase n=2 Tax=Methylobacterium iners TaxID=418707 RepID=A0ABQ4RXY8_9HYPH|nr:hypothetical protein OCOJLMKI_1705 [Methylobacterium iners]
MGFDDVVLLARNICNTSVALVSLIAGNRQWFKARVGFPECETDLNHSVCAHVLSEPDLLVIPDLTKDPRTRANPLVAGGPRIRFYAGAPLRTPEGKVLGSLCVIDGEPRPGGLTHVQAESLRALASQVMAQMELRRALADQRRVLEEREGLIRTQAEMSVARGDLGTILDALVHGAMEAIPHAEGAVIEMCEGDELVYSATKGNLMGHVGLRVPLQGSLAGACLLTNEPLLVPDVLVDRRVKRDLIDRLRLRSCVLAPVRRAGKPVGVLKLQSSQPDVFTQADLRLMQVFAGTVSAGLAEAGEAAARREAARSERRRQAVFDSAADYAIILLDLDGNVTDWNEGATAILGWRPEEMCGKPADIFFTPEDREAGIPGMEMHSALTEGRGIDERWHLRRDGTRFWANGEMMALRDEDGTAIGFMKILRDRTEQRLSYERLHEAKDRLRRAQEAGGVGMFVVDADGVLHPTPEFCRLYGLPVREAYPSTAFEHLVIPEDAHLVSTAVTRASGEAPRDVEYRIRRPDTGEIRWIARKGDLEYDDLGRPVRFAGVSRDITEQRLAREALAESERRKSALLELGDRLRDLSRTSEMTLMAAEIVGRTLNAGRAGFGRLDALGEHVDLELDWTAVGLRSIAGRHRFEDYGDLRRELLRGEPVIVRDACRDPRTAACSGALQALDVASLINMPVRERGRTVALFFVHDRVPRDWSREELGFLRAVADRVEAAVARVRAEEQQQLLNRELSHRMKNTLAMVQAIATQTLRGASDIEAAKEVLAARLIALGKAHDILMTGDGESQGTDIRTVIENALSLHEDPERQRFDLQGPHVPCGARAALSLALMVHELATNAAKYGALSTPTGRVVLTWEVGSTGDTKTVRLTWREEGGPRVTAPSRVGFGSRLIERGLAGAVGGQVELRYPPEGMCCTLVAPLTGFLAEG